MTSAIHNAEREDASVYSMEWATDRISARQINP
uniref:Uncharacterized protein n=1 Tax=Moniliophthora roreri TaxID=221103 RepID=A0A0W0G131_MONRR